MGTAIDWSELLANYEHDCIGGVVLDREFNIRAISDAVLERGGYTRDEALSMSALDMVHPDDLARAADVISEVVQIEGRRSPGMYRLVFRDGGFESFELSAVNLGEEAEGAVVMTFSEASLIVRSNAFSEDIVEITQLLVEPRSRAESLGRLIDFVERHVEGSTVAVTTFSADGTSTTISRRELPGDLTEANDAAHPLSLPPSAQAAVDLHMSGPWMVSTRAGVLHDDDPGRLTMSLVDDGATVLGYVTVVRPWSTLPDEQEWLAYASAAQMLRALLIREGLDSQLRFAADHDSLTGLLNRRRLLEAMEQADELGGSGLLMIDLDKFSWINNTLGHAAGDTALVSAAESLKAATPDDAMVARLGGDEFVVWLPHLESLDDIYRLAERVRAEMIVPIDNADRREMVRCSVGATVIRAGESVEHAIHRADDAMYEAKRSGGDRVKQN